MYRITATYDGNDTVIHGRLDPNARVSGAVLKEAVNVIPTFSFTIYPNNPGYEMMQDMLTGISVRDCRTGETIFKGRVYSVSDMMDATGQIYKNVTCEGELSYLCDTIQPPKVYTSQPTSLSTALSAILSAHNTRVGSSSGKRIQAGNITGGFEPYETDYTDTFSLVKDICELAGNEFALRYDNGIRYLDSKPSLGVLSDTVIKFGDNLRSLQRAVETKDIVTRLYPLGAVSPNDGRRLTLSEIQPFVTNPDSDIVHKYGVAEAVKIYDNIVPEDWSATSSINAARDRLYAAALHDLKKMNTVFVSFSIEALDLSLINGDYDSLRIYNTYRVRTKLQGIDEEVRLTGRTLELDNPQNPMLTFGQKQTTLTSMIAGQ